MKIFINLLKYNIFFLLLLIFLSNHKVESKMSFDEFNNYFSNKTLDRIRQIYWNIILDLESKGIYDKSIQFFKRNYAEEYLHSINRIVIMYKLEDYYKYFDIELDDFVAQMEKIDIFKKDNIDYLFSNQMPRHFLINFAINIDKFERIKYYKLDGISDYINYFTNDKIIEYLKNKLSVYKSEIENNFDKIVLNNIDIQYDSFVDYYKDKTREELIDIVHGIENYYFNLLNKTNDAYYFYEHGNLINIESKEIYQMIALYNKEIYLDNIDDFMYQIEFRNFTYIINKKFLEMKKPELSEKLIILEKYYKRQTNQEKSLRRLNDYINRMKVEYQKMTLSWGLSIFPELYGDGIFEDISSSEISLKYGEVKEFIQVSERNILLKYVYNIHTYQNNIKSIYDNDLFNFYRYKNDLLYEEILSDTNNNRDLQTKNTFIEYADLKKDNFYEYIKYLERSQLKKILAVIIKIYYKEKMYIEENRAKSETFTKMEVMEYYDKQQLSLNIKDYIMKSSNLTTETTSKFFKNFTDNLDGQTEYYIGYFNNIHDFLRSTNIRYLKKWLRKIENYYRNDYLIEEMQGGMKYNFLTKLSKEDMLELFDVYLTRFPEYFEPNNFINNVGLDDDITPHKMLVDLFYNMQPENNNSEIIMQIAYSLTGYFQRRNIQTNFDISQFLNQLNNSLNNNDHIHSFLFQFFRLINMFPELNNKKLFEMFCLNNDTRIINLNESNHQEFYLKRGKLKLSKNIQYYLNNTNQYDNKNLDEMNEEELQKYILAFINSHQYRDKYELKSQILDGYFPFIIYDYFQSYLYSIDDEHLKFIFNNIKHMCSQNYPCNDTSDAKNIEEKRKEAITDLINVQEFQNPVFFDKNFDYIENIEKGSFKEFLVNSTNKDLRYYTIMCYIIKLEQCENSYETYCQGIFDEIPHQLFYMSKNEMIRYILKESEYNKDMINENMLPILIDYYKIDLGSDNIYDLTLY